MIPGNGYSTGWHALTGMLFEPEKTRAEELGIRLGDTFVKCLAILLLGYALMGKSFAYLGFPPLFAGEIVLMIGLAAVAMSRNVLRVAEHWITWLLVAFMVWCFFRVIPYIGQYKIDAIRDAMLWGYGLYALVLGVLLTERPARLKMLLSMARWFGPLILICGPMVVLLTRFCETNAIFVPWASVPIFLVKGGDFMVHLTLAVAMVGVGLSAMPMGWLVSLTLLNVMLNIQGRAGLVAFVMGMFIFMILRPGNRLLWWLISLTCLGLVLFWATDLQISVSNDTNRVISFDQLLENAQSIVGSSNKGDMDGTKEWRLKWWNKIINYTFNGEYFWTGKGFGVNLADDDGFQVKDKDQSQLRSPHNGHLCILARAGVPGMVMWCSMHLIWLTCIANAWYVSYRNKHAQWSRLFLVLLVVQVGMIINASFDVYLEGPMGGIWFWSCFGIGLASLWIYKHQPQCLMEDAEQAQTIAFQPITISPASQKARMARMSQMRTMVIHRLHAPGLPGPSDADFVPGVSVPMLPEKQDWKNPQPHGPERSVH